MKSPSADVQRRSLALCRRRWTAYFAFPFAIGLLISGIGAALIAYDNLPEKFALAVAGVCLLVALCVALPVGRSSWLALTDKEPVLIVDATGITDRFHLHAFVPWSDIKSVNLHYGDGTCLSILLRDGVKGPGGKLVEPSVGRAVKRAFTGSDLTIPLGSLTYNPNKLRDLITYYKRA